MKRERLISEIFVRNLHLIHCFLVQADLLILTSETRKTVMVRRVRGANEEKCTTNYPFLIF